MWIIENFNIRMEFSFFIVLNYDIIFNFQRKSWFLQKYLQFDCGENAIMVNWFHFRISNIQISTQ